MQWDVDFDICALVILTAIIFLHVSRKYVPIQRNRVFLTITILELAAVLCNITVKLGGTASGNLSQGGFAVLLVLYYALQYAVPIAFMYYMVAWSGQSLKVDWLARILFVIPIAVYAIEIIRNCLYQNLYILDEQYVYLETGEISIMNIMALYCMLAGLVYALLHTRLLSFDKLTTIAMMVVAIGIFVVVQYYIQGTDFIDFLVAISLFVLYFVAQNPSDMLDEGTQVLSRNMLDELLRMEISEKMEFDLIVLALDDFKFVNKTFGIPVGDMMLRQVAHFMQSLTKKGMVYRYGADQFALQIRHGKEDMDDVLDDVKERFRHPWITEEVSVMLSATISCVSYPEDGDRLENIVDVIDYSILLAKKSKKGSVVFAKNMDLQSVREEKAIEKAVGLAIERDTIEVYYQPIFSTEKNCFTSAEALVRLHDEILGDISPEIFIPIAERNGTIVKLGTMIFEKVCKFISENNLKNTTIEYIEVNVSVVQCMQQNFVESLMDIMEEYHVEPDQINLEVTETAAVNSVAILKENIESLHRKGISFSLDDYGSGYSTLGYLHQLPFKIIKLDKLMVWDAFENERAGITLKFTVGMLKEMQVRIVAEGVETLEQQMHLAGIGCDYLQGWYYSKAIPANQFAELIQKA